MFSALPPKADSNRTSRHVRKVPILFQKSAYRRRGTADAFFEAIHCHPLLCGRLTLDFTDACNAYAAHKGANGGGRATNLASLRRFCAIAAKRELELGTAWPAQSQPAEPQDTLQVRKQHFDTFPVAG